MIRAIFGAALAVALVLGAGPASARHRHHGGHHIVRASVQPICVSLDPARLCQVEFAVARPAAVTRGALKRRPRINEAQPVQRAVRPSLGLGALVAPLATKAAEIAASCGSSVISGLRHTFVAGTRLVSLHASGRAVDMSGNPACIYAHLAGWPGGFSIDYAAVRHVHISYDADGRREWGARFRHGGGGHHRARHARRRR
jgi:hypothetical protein